MTPEEQRLYEMLNIPRPPAAGIASVQAAPASNLDAGGIPDIAAYLGLHGDFLGGHYKIDPRRPVGWEIPLHMQYTRPLYGGELNAEATLTPEQRALLIQYHKDF